VPVRAYSPAMARIRHTVIALLATLGLLLAVQPIGAQAAACSMDEAAAMPMHRHSNAPAPMSSSGVQYCPACLAVLPSLPIIEPHVLPPVALVAAQPHRLLGIDPALDPPPPRGA